MADDSMTPEQEEALLALSKVLFKQNPKEFKRFAKKIKPDLHVPELETEEEMQKALAERDAKIEDLSKRIDTNERSNSVLKVREDLAKKNYTKEEITSIEDLIKTKRVSNYDDAELIFNASRKIAEPTPMRFRPLEKKEDFDAFSNPQTARDVARKAIDDINFGRVKID